MLKAVQCDQHHKKNVSSSISLQFLHQDSVTDRFENSPINAVQVDGHGLNSAAFPMVYQVCKVFLH